MRSATCSRQLLIRLAELLVLSRPGDTVMLYRRVVASTIEETSNRAYGEAVQLIPKIGSLMKKQKQTEQFRAYLVDLHVQYKAKRNFIKLLHDVIDAPKE